MLMRKERVGRRSRVWQRISDAIPPRCALEMDRSDKYPGETADASTRSTFSYSDELIGDDHRFVQQLNRELSHRRVELIRC